MPHSNWKGYLRLSLVSIPVRAYSTGTPARERIEVHQLHRPCHHRIRYKKTCPVHGEVPNDEMSLVALREVVEAIQTAPAAMKRSASRVPIVPFRTRASPPGRNISGRT